MRLKKKYYYGPNPKTIGLAEAVTWSLSGAEYDSGALEQVIRTAENATTHIGILIELLHSKKLITDEEALALAPNFEKA